MLRKNIMAVCFSVAMVSMSTASANDQVYYQIGGGALSDKSLDRFNSFEIALDPYVGGAYSCGDFDVQESVKKLVEEISDIPDEFADYIEVAAVDLLYGLAAISLQRASPGLYEFLTNSYARHKEYVEIRLASCQTIENGIDNGSIKGFRDLAKLYSWRRSAETNTSIQEAEEFANADQGVPWIDGNAGGFGQEPIRAVKDSVAVGFENMFGKLGSPEGEGSFIKNEFPDVEAAQDWANRVLGERSISFISDSDTTTGSGLESEIAKELIDLDLTLIRILSNTAGASSADLESLSTPIYRITPSALSAINSQPASTQIILRERLASEIATYKSIERAFFIRSLIMSSLEHPSFYYSDVAPAMVQKLVDRIDDDINVVRERSLIRREFVGDLLMFAINESKAVERSSTILPTLREPSETLPDGSVLKQPGE